jgi:hypothetical protein
MDGSIKKQSRTNPETQCLHQIISIKKEKEFAEIIPYGPVFLMNNRDLSSISCICSVYRIVLWNVLSYLRVGRPLKLYHKYLTELEYDIPNNTFMICGQKK